ncbi:MFS transporter [Komagataeibacter rhaeticus]|uniref:MFS transporter n=1 Tax=Komagataeibacter rhaeticus TaxID=215221 RepID=A0A181C6U1_9PROT|nr:MFS transporter [Komagataeibacter rhaeticus]ATU73829.1 MFS transporter [Komagataeibacter xylinus]EGG78405.1 Putative transporter yebQ [Gluconacetobacter sp. SXCC-1]KDU94820.1 transporter [Komagataeibacter rhaeticus AF1]PYD55081.1 MFS transporter [Komagataeibacter rhaeticus]QIP34275.1 MFS transporter [Komagataeibacter rhaeticus]
MPPPSKPVLTEGEGLHGAARVRAVTAVALSVLLALLDYAIANVALPTIAGDLHVSPASAVWIVNAYQLASVVSLLPMAALGTRIGFARLCQIGLALLTVASLFCALSHSLLALALARAVQGVGGACIMSVSIALIRFIYPHAILGRGIALNGVMVALGVGGGPTVASIILSFASWPWLFLINIPLGATALVLALVSLPRTPVSPGSFDGASALLNVLAFGALIMAGDSIAHHAGAVQVTALAITGLAAGWLLVRRQHGQTHPMFPIDMLRIRAFRNGTLVGFVAFVASNLFMISFPFTLQSMFHYPPSIVGLLMTPWPVGIMAVAPLISRLSDRVPAAILSSVGLGMTSLGFLALYLLPAAPAWFDIAWRIALGGMGFGVFQPPNNRIMMVTAPPGRSGSASGMVQIARQCGQATGAMFVAMAFGLITHDAERSCLGFGAIVAFIGMLCSAARLLGPRPTARTHAT